MAKIWKCFCMNEVLQSNTRGSSHFEKHRVKKYNIRRAADYFSKNCEIIEIVIKHFLHCLILNPNHEHQKNKILVKNSIKNSVSSFVMKELLHGSRNLKSSA